MIKNKHGQTLILFIILIPLILGIMALVVDVGLVMSKTASLKETTKLVIKNSLTKKLSTDQIKELFVKNGIEITNLDIKTKQDEIKITNKIKVDSIFGSIIGIKKYNIKINIKGYKKNNKIIIE